MPISDELVDMLHCPVERRPLRPMSPDELRGLNRAIARGKAAYRGGAPVAEALEGGLVGTDGASFYAVREGIPVLLPGQRITVRDPGSPEAGAGGAAAADDAAEALWKYLAAVWKDRKPPARPAPQDTALLERMVGEALAGCEAPRALLLGVTPEIATMRWPAGTRLFAVDGSAAMIREVWPAAKVRDAAVIRGNWTAMPFRDGVFDVVVGDASLGFQPYPDPFFGVVGEVRRVLESGGALATRMYTRPETREPVEAIFADLRAGRIGTVEFLWWRLFTALHGDRARGGSSRDVREAWDANVADEAALGESLGWPPEELRKMDELKHASFTFIFPTLREIRSDLAAAFEETACESPALEGGDRNPTFVFRPRPH